MRPCASDRHDTKSRALSLHLYPRAATTSMRGPVLCVLLALRCRHVFCAQYLPVGGTLNATAFARWVTASVAAGNRALSVAPGNYSVKFAARQLGHVVLMKLANIQLHMEGVTLVMQDRYSTALYVYAWANVTLTGLTVRYAEPPTNTAHIVGMNGVSWDVLVPPGYPTQDWTAPVFASMMCTVHGHTVYEARYVERHGHRRPCGDWGRCECHVPDYCRQQRTSPRGRARRRSRLSLASTACHCGGERGRELHLSRHHPVWRPLHGGLGDGFWQPGPAGREYLQRSVRSIP